MNANLTRSLRLVVHVDDLSEIQLLPDTECHQSLHRPPNIPELNLSALSPYCEEVIPYEQLARMLRTL